MPTVPLNDPKPDDNDKLTEQVPRKGRLWVWFLAGFSIVFIGMSLLVATYSMSASGESIVSCKLWQYYVLEIRKSLNSSGNLGPATGSFSSALTMFFQHMLYSAVGGAVMMCVGWTVRKGQKQAANETTTEPGT